MASAIRRARARANLSAKEVARRADLSPSYVSKIERGECLPSARVVGAIAAVVQLSPLELWVAMLLDASHEDGRDPRGDVDRGDVRA